jgi:hypothetical protein
MHRIKVTTTTTLVLEALVRADDFRTARQLIADTGRSYNQVLAALHHLRKYHAIDSLESDGALWWYITGEDTRTTVRDERTPETRQRRPRKVRRKS